MAFSLSRCLGTCAVALVVTTACQPATESPVPDRSGRPSTLSEPPASGEKRQLQAADYQRAERFLPAARGRFVRNDKVVPHWIGEGNRFWYVRTNSGGGREFVQVDAATGEKAPAFDHAAISAALAAVRPPGELPVGELPFDAFSYSQGGHDGAIDFSVDGVHYTCSPQECTVSPPVEPPFGPGFTVSPDRQWAVYFKNDNLWLRSVDGATDRALTTDGVKDYTYGIDLGTSTSYISMARMGLERAPMVTWSPDSRRLVTMLIDQRQVEELSLVDFVPEDGSFRPKTINWKFTFVGDAHPATGTYVVFDIVSGRQIAVDFPAITLIHTSLTPPDTLEIWWHKGSSEFGFTYRKPFARGYAFLNVDAETGQVTTLFSRTTMRTSSPGTAILTPPDAHQLDDGSFLFASDESNWRHLYRRSSDGAITQLTAGEWNVVSVPRVDQKRGLIYFSRGVPDTEGNPYFRYLYSMSLDGSNQRLLTPAVADHGGFYPVQAGGDPQFSPNGEYFVDNYGSLEMAGQSELRDREGRLITVLEQADVSALDTLGFMPPQPFTSIATDGKTPLYGDLFFPSDFDPSRHYPVIDASYPGPQRSRVAHKLPDALYKDYGTPQALAELGFIVMTLDARGTPGRSRDFLYPPGVNVLAAAGFLEDHVAAIQQLAQQHPYIDASRVGIYGWSGGGYASTRAMLVYPDFFKVAVSGAGNHDQRIYLPLWAEYYLGEDDGENYAAASNLNLAKNLKGKLLLIHGGLDDNVNPATTLQMAQALISANKDFDLLLLPRLNHDPVQDHPDTYYHTRRLWDYFVVHLQGALPPADYQIGEEQLP